MHREFVYICIYLPQGVGCVTIDQLMSRELTLFPAHSVSGLLVLHHKPKFGKV